MSRRQVLVTTDVVGGVWDFALSLAAHLPAADVTLLAIGEPTQPQRAAARSGGTELRVARGLRLEWMQGGDADIAATRELVGRVARDMRADVVHANQFAAACADVSVPLVLTLHSDVLSWRRFTLGDRTLSPEWHTYANLVRTAIHRADHVVAVSHFLADQVLECYGVTRPIEVIHNGWPAPPATSLAPDAPPATLLAGRLWDAAKNIALAAEAAHGWQPGEVWFAGEAVHPDSGGRGEVPPGLTALGVLDRADLDARMQRAAIYLSPARYDPFGLLPLQAALHDCALLLSDIPSYRELWAGAARFFRADDAADLRRQWQRVLVDVEDRTRLQHAARERALANFSARGMADAYASVYARQRVAA